MDNNKSFEEQWPEHRERLKNEYPHLKDEDLHYEAGQHEELVLRLAEKLKKTKTEIRNWLHIMG
jgi:hypothetical protein